MKKLLSSALSAAMVIAMVASTAVVVGAEETKQPDYDKYVSEELAPKYGYADVQEKNRLIDELSAAGFTNEDLSGWNKYNGILGYNVVDLNNDSKDDLLVYYFDDETNINTLKADFFTTNENGEIYNADTVVLDTQDGLNIDYCVGGMTEFNGKEYLYIETAIFGVRSNGYDAVNAFYTCDDNNKLITDYRMYRNDMTTYGLEIRNEDGSYNTETCDDVYSAFDKMGFDVTYKSVANVLSDLGFNNYEGHSWLANIPSYYGHSSLKNLFYVVCAPIDPTDNTDEEELLDYKSIIYMENDVNDDNVESDVSSVESDTYSDVNSNESATSTTSDTSSQISSVASENTSSDTSSTSSKNTSATSSKTNASSKNTSTATSKTTSTNTTKSVDTVKTAGLISVIGLIVALFVAGVVVVMVKKKADKE